MIDLRNYVKPAQGAYKLSSLSTGVIQKFISAKLHEGYSRNTLVSLKGIVSGSLKYAVQTAKFIPANPANQVRIPSSRVQPNVPARMIKRAYINKEQIEAILKRFPYGSSCHLPILFAYRCGLRLSEAYGVMWDDIDFKSKTLHVRQQAQYVNGEIVFTAPKYGSFRKIRLDNYMLALLKKAQKDQQENRKYYAEYYTDNYMNENFRLILKPEKGAKRIYPVNIREDGSFIQPRCEMHSSRVIHHQLGFKNYNFHSLRHTHATMLAENGALPKDIQNRLGHKDISVTMQIYVHLTKDMEDVSIDILDKMPIPEAEV